MKSCSRFALSFFVLRRIVSLRGSVNSVGTVGSSDEDWQFSDAYV